MRRHWPFFLSCLLAFAAGHMINYSVIMYAQEVLHSDLLAGIGFGLCFGPPLLLGWYAGVLCDRHSPVRIIHAAQGVFVLATLVLLLADRLVADPAARVPLVLGAALLAGIGWSFAAPARMTTLGLIVGAEQLRQASLLFNLLVMLGFGLGPLAISLCRVLAGWSTVFGVAALLLVAGSMLLLGLQAQPSRKPHRPVRQEIAEALRAVRANPLIAQLLAAAVLGYTLVGPMQVLLPKIARTGLGLSELGRGAFLGALAPSLIAGGLLCLPLARLLPHGKTILTALAGSGLLFAAMAQMQAPLAAVALLAGVGITGGIAISLIVAGIQENVDSAVRGRVLSMYTIASQVVPAASGVAAGVLAQALDVRRAALACALALAAAAVLAALGMRSLRRYRGAPTALPATAAAADRP
jgi:MFS family permease